MRRETRCLELEYTRGIFYFGVKDGANLDVADLEEYVGIAEEMLGDDVPVPILTRLGRIKSSTPGARRIVVEPRYARLCLRTAILVQNPVARVIGSVFLGLSNLPYETKLFSDESLALDWLREAQAPAHSEA